MPSSKIKQERRIYPVIEFNDGMGKKIEIRSPVLLSIFQSEELMESYKKDPNKKYSVKQIMDMKVLDVKEATIRRSLRDNEKYFETTKEVEVRGKKGNKTVMVVNFTKLKPISAFIFKAVEEMWEQEK